MESQFRKGSRGLFLLPLLIFPSISLLGSVVSRTPTAGSLAQAASMHVARASHTSTLLPNGMVLVAGGFAGSGTEYKPYRSVELYDPTTGSFQPAGNMATGRSGHTATLLKNGKVLLVGGWTGQSDAPRSAELYDSATATFSPTGNTVIGRAGCTATLLADGRVLLAGGVDNTESALATAELYDPARGTFTLTGNLTAPRGGHTATLLKNGKVLIIGGGSGHYPSQSIYRSAELYDPATGKFTSTGEMSVARHKHASLLLPSGKVLVVGGSDNRDWRGEYSSAEIFDPAKGEFKPTGSMSESRFKLPEAVVLMDNGQVLVAGGGNLAEVFVEAKGTFTTAKGSFGQAHFFASAIPLPHNKVLITGGYAEINGSLPATTSAWLYQP
jgi:hypothetical protein